MFKEEEKDEIGGGGRGRKIHTILFPNFECQVSTEIENFRCEFQIFSEIKYKEKT